MRVAYFDCSSGVAGNMVLGALLDAGLSGTYLRKELRKLPLPRYSLRVTRPLKQGIKATLVEVNVQGKEEPRRLKDIISLIKKSRLSRRVKEQSIKIFRRLAEAEARSHGVPLNQLHFHEVGYTDAIIDIVGAVMGLEKLAIDELYSSPINVGSGKVHFSHGTFPVPAPATAQLLKGIPFYSTKTGIEAATPTGVAILTSLAKGFGEIPRISLEIFGYGAGSKQIKGLNHLIVYIGEKEVQSKAEAVLMLEANLDDMNPKHFDKAIASLMKAGALDAYLQPLRMKKGRDAVKITALCRPAKREAVLKAFFRSTPTLGVRIYMVKREVLDRSYIKLGTKLGELKVKAGRLGDKIMTLSPEFEDLKKIASKHRTPLASVLRDLSFNY